MSYDSDMVTTGPELGALLDRVNEATKRLQRSTTVPDDVLQLIDSFEPALGAATPLRLEANPYLTTTMWAAAYSAEKALRHDNDEDRRRDVRIALEQFRHALRDIVANQPFKDDAPVREVLARTAGALAAPRRPWPTCWGFRSPASALARSRRPGAGDRRRRAHPSSRANREPAAAFIHGSGVVAWFYREHPVLGRRPVDLLDDPLCYPRLLGAATGARAMTA